MNPSDWEELAGLTARLDELRSQLEAAEAMSKIATIYALEEGVNRENSGHNRETDQGNQAKLDSHPKALPPLRASSDIRANLQCARRQVTNQVRIALPSWLIGP